VRPVAFVTGTPNGPQALKAAIAQNLPYDLTGLGIEAMDELPMTPTGKIAKAELARLAAEKGS
jgi:acyl-CoA synthetase (AMP-forming)/AMP-acid ligase II